VLKKEGTLWLNLGDSYAAHKDCKQVSQTLSMGTNSEQSCVLSKGNSPTRNSRILKSIGLKDKDLVGIPWRVAFALQADGWYLRQDIIWHKPNPMPESVTDRCTKAHEYIFLMSKNGRYYYDQQAIKEPIKDTSIARLIQDVESQARSDRIPRKTNGNMKAVKFGGKEWIPTMAGGGTSYKNGHSGYFDKDGKPLCGVMANKKSVWTVTTKGYKEAHFATFPPDLIKPCILAGCPEGGIVLDPFFGSGTTGLVCSRLNREYIGIELNEQYVEMAKRRIEGDAPLLNGGGCSV
jgi:DNA modification methylase